MGESEDYTKKYEMEKSSGGPGRRRYRQPLPYSYMPACLFMDTRIIHNISFVRCAIVQAR